MKLREKHGSSFPSMVSLATGPSRTADIEKTLVVGVHGPKEVFCFLIDE
jgi:L-lactate dehydrogenase complex protein LldG